MHLRPTMLAPSRPARSFQASHAFRVSATAPLFASWTRPDGERRPAVLVAVLVVAFTAGLFVPWFTSYFGLTEAAEPVFETVLPALILWFLVLTAVYRFRLLDRALGFDLLAEHRTPRR